MQSADCILSPMQSADCAGSQIACNICIYIYMYSKTCCNACTRRGHFGLALFGAFMVLCINYIKRNHKVQNNAANRRTLNPSKNTIATYKLKLVHLTLCLQAAKLFHKSCLRMESRRLKKVQQIVQLFNIILKRSTS